MICIKAGWAPKNYVSHDNEPQRDEPMNNRILAGGALAVVLAGVFLWEVADAQYAGPRGGGPWGPGMMGAYGYAMGPGMMGAYSYGMGPGMMGQGWRGQQANMNLSVNDVKSYLERSMALSGNAHIKVGNVVEKDADTITADIVTTDKDALVQRFAVNRHTGLFQPEGG